MKTIKEAAKEYAISLHADDCHLSISEIEMYAKTDFEAGVEFAQRWIPVEEELPKNANEIILKNEKWITEYNPNGTRMGYMDNERKKLFYSAYWDENGQCYSMSEEQPTHWRPIELK